MKPPPRAEIIGDQIAEALGDQPLAELLREILKGAEALAAKARRPRRLRLVGTAGKDGERRAGREGKEAEPK